MKLKILSLFVVFGSLCVCTAYADDSNRLDSIIESFCNADKNSVLVVAHRGAHKQYPENSLASIQAAIDMQVDIVEVDVRKTKDGHLVLMHDKTIDRTTNGNGLVSKMTLEQIKKYRLKENDGTLGNHIVPTLEEAMLIARDRIVVNLDKSEKIVPECIMVLKKTKTEKQALFKSSGNTGQLLSVLKKHNCNSFYMPIVVSKGKDNDPVDTDSYKKFKADIELSGSEAVELVFHRNDSILISPQAIKFAASKDVRLWCNSLNGIGAGSDNEHTDRLAVSDPEGNWGWIIKNGISIIQTDELESLLKYLRSRGLHD